MSLPLPVTASNLARTPNLRDRKWANESSETERINASQAYPLFGGILSVHFLRSRAKTTNLAVILLAFVACLSLLGNLRLYFASSGLPLQLSRQGPPIALQRTVPAYHHSLRHLVIVPGHAIWIGNQQSIGDAADDEDWILEDYQRGGSVKTFIKHIVKAVELTATDPHALLVFSGGQSRRAIQATEAISYLRYAEAAQLFQQFAPTATPANQPFPRATTEEFALDSYENLLFSVARFREVTGHYPDRITVVGYGMKRKRFEEVHRAALRWPRDRFSYIGIDNDHENGQGYAGELQNGLQPFLADTYGCHTDLLAKKRGRNAYNRYHPYLTSAPEMAGLIQHCPARQTAMYDGRLPWREA